MSKIIFEAKDDARSYYRMKTSNVFNNILLRKGLDVHTVNKDNIEKLREKLKIVIALLEDKEYIKSKTYEFTTKNDFTIKDNSYTSMSIMYSIGHVLLAAKEYIEERINQLEQSTSVLSIKQLVEELPENEIKKNLKIEIEELEDKKIELLKIKEGDRENLKELMELGKHKADIFAKRSDVFLKFLDRESIASMIGSILLLLMGVCLLVMMFIGKEPIKIVESAFLLILGYFFGHSKNKQ